MNVYKLITIFFIVEVIVGCDLTTKGFPQDPLLEAASKGNVDEIKRLVKNGRDVNYWDRNGETAMHHAARWCQKDAIYTLHDLGATVDVKSKNNDHPLHVASTKPCHDTNKILIDSGANINAKGQYGETVLHKATKFGLIENVRLYIDNKADVRLTDKAGRTALQFARFRLNRHNKKLKKAKEKYKKCLQKKARNDRDAHCIDRSKIIKAKVRKLNEIINYLESV